jgi:hypothetical protein
LKDVTKKEFQALAGNDFITMCLEECERVREGGVMRGREVEVSHEVKVRGDGGERGEDRHVTVRDLISGERERGVGVHVSLEKREFRGSGEVFLRHGRGRGGRKDERDRAKERW